MNPVSRVFFVVFYIIVVGISFADQSSIRTDELRKNVEDGILPEYRYQLSKGWHQFHSENYQDAIRISNQLLKDREIKVYFSMHNEMNRSQRIHAIEAFWGAVTVWNKFISNTSSDGESYPRFIREDQEFTEPEWRQSRITVVFQKTSDSHALGMLTNAEGSRASPRTSNWNIYVSTHYVRKDLFGMSSGYGRFGFGELRQIISHELGHFFGLDHFKGRQNLMMTNRFPIDGEVYSPSKTESEVLKLFRREVERLKRSSAAELGTKEESSPYNTNSNGGETTNRGAPKIFRFSTDGGFQ